MSAHAEAVYIPEIAIDMLEPGRRARKGRHPVVLGRDIEFSVAGLQSYAFAGWSPVIHDATVVAAAVEYGDRVIKRPPHGWARRISVRIPVHEPHVWNGPDVSSALHDAVEFLTGDYWTLEFVPRSRLEAGPAQKDLRLGVETKAVLAYSDGLDSRAVAGIQGQKLGETLVRVRVGSKSWDRAERNGAPEPFAKVPYDVRCDMPNRESSARSRGFKFALISIIAAHLSDAEEIIVPESGQGAIGPALLNVGHAYPDYRNHPLFTSRMERLARALFRKQIKFAFPRIWHTKGETLREFISLPGDRDWLTTRSCWRSNRWSSLNRKLRQCGVCAACMLRRLSVHAAGLNEPPETYICTNLNAKTLDGGIETGFTRKTRVFREYAIAGALHLDHLADMASDDAAPVVARHATLLAPALCMTREQAKTKLSELLRKHAGEWNAYLGSLEEHSFLKHWVRAKR